MASNTNWNSLIAFYSTAYKASNECQLAIIKTQLELCRSNNIATSQVEFYNDYLNQIMTQQNNILRQLEDVNYALTSRRHIFRTPTTTTPLLNNRSVLNSQTTETVSSNEIDVREEIFENIENPTNTQCPITFENFETTSQVSVISRCGHIFNRQALTDWLVINPVCPLCRSSTTLPNNSNNNSNNRTHNNRSEFDSTTGPNIRNTLSNLTQSILQNLMNNQQIFDGSGTSIQVDIPYGTISFESI
jgi:hypothetical protein